ncbi:MAG: hypothetical protein AAF732_22925 [Pseudomonadota bacterium]
MTVDIESMLSGPSLERYRAFCEKHPWYREASELIYEWDQQIKVMRAQGEDLDSLYEDRLALPVDEVINFAKDVKAHPDVWFHFADYVERQKTDPDAEFDPDWTSVVGPFSNWYFLKRGKPPQIGKLFAGRGIILMFLRGELPSLDGKEARAYALRMPGTKE